MCGLGAHVQCGCLGWACGVCVMSLLDALGGGCALRHVQFFSPWVCTSARAETGSLVLCQDAGNTALAPRPMLSLRVLWDGRCCAVEGDPARHHDLPFNPSMTWLPEEPWFSPHPPASTGAGGARAALSSVETPTSDLSPSVPPPLTPVAIPVLISP